MRRASWGLLTVRTVEASSQAGCGPGRPGEDQVLWSIGWPTTSTCTVTWRVVEGQVEHLTLAQVVASNQVEVDPLLRLIRQGDGGVGEELLHHVVLGGGVSWELGEAPTGFST